MVPKAPWTAALSFRARISKEIKFGCTRVHTPPKLLEVELKAELNVARSRRRGDFAETGAVRRSGRITKVRMIKHIEELGAKFQGKALADPRPLNERHVPLVDAGTE